MKTPEDWKKVYDEIASEIRESGLFGLGLDKIHDEGFKKFVKAIQLDAMKEGAKLAAKIVRVSDNSRTAKHLITAKLNCEILAASEQLTEKDL